MRREEAERAVVLLTKQALNEEDAERLSLLDAARDALEATYHLDRRRGREVALDQSTGSRATNVPGTEELLVTLLREWLHESCDERRGLLGEARDALEELYARDHAVVVHAESPDELCLTATFVGTPPAPSTLRLASAPSGEVVVTPGMGAPRVMSKGDLKRLVEWARAHLEAAGDPS